MTTITTTGRNYLRTFDSFSELLALAESPAAAADDTRSSVQPSRGLQWDLGATLADSLRLAREGWPEGRANADKWREKFAALIAPEITRKETTEAAICGDYCDAGLFAAGVPECMIAFMQDEVEGRGQSDRIIEIGIDFGAHCQITADQVMLRGGALLALIDAIESHGLRAEINARKATENEGHWYEMHFPIKAADQPLDIDCLAFITAHPAMQRRVYFSAVEHESPAIRKAMGYAIRDGYGYSRSTRTPAAIQMPQIFAEAEIKEWLIAQLTTLGIVTETSKA